MNIKKVTANRSRAFLRSGRLVDEVPVPAYGLFLIPERGYVLWFPGWDEVIEHLRETDIVRLDKYL